MLLLAHFILFSNFKPPRPLRLWLPGKCCRRVVISCNSNLKIFKLKEEGMATQTSILPWRTSCTDEPGELQSMCCRTRQQRTHTHRKLGFLGGSHSQESVCNVGDLGSTPGSGRSHGEGNCYPLQDSHLENSMDRGACRAIDHGMAKSQTTEQLTLSLQVEKRGPSQMPVIYKQPQI